MAFHTNHWLGYANRWYLDVLLSKPWEFNGIWDLDTALTLSAIIILVQQ